MAFNYLFYVTTFVTKPISYFKWNNANPILPVLLASATMQTCLIRVSSLFTSAFVVTSYEGVMLIIYLSLPFIWVRGQWIS